MEQIRTATSSKIVRIILAIVLIVLAFGLYKYYALSKEHNTVKTDLGNKITEYEKKIAEFEHENTSLNDALYAEQVRNDAFRDQIEEITGAIGTLEKLSQIDPELLKKYSKVFFLNEHYTPKKLSKIDQKYVIGEKELQAESKVLPFLRKMITAAASDDVEIKIVSAYRAFGTQAALKSNYSVIYGAGTANQFSADQGYSEHQLGTTFDLTNPTIGASLTNFQASPEYAWLVKNAYKYGFVLSYPENNAYYEYEPWHWRFVGDKLARHLDDEDMFFYDMDQREIDKYLINLFD